MRFPGNGSRPVPSALPVNGLWTIVGAALKSPFLNASVGIVARCVRPASSSVCW
jgi:hypothetical protein